MAKVASTPYWQPSRKTISEDALVAFSKKLHERMVELGLTQADLARKAFGEYVEGGVKKVKDRDKISLYLRGKGLPGEDKMRKLAKALGMQLEDLAPPIAAPGSAPRPKADGDGTAHASHRQPTGVGIEPAGGGLVWLTVRVRVSDETALKVYSLIKSAKEA